MSEELIIDGKIYSVTFEKKRQAELKFFEENPRVYSQLSGDTITQSEIEEIMINLDRTKELKENIKANGGLIEPLIVDSNGVVLEGNTRLAAYRILSKEDCIKWGCVACKILPSNMTQKEISKLLAQLHIVGRKDWDPFEQASYLDRMVRDTKTPIKALAQELGLGEKKANQMIEVITFMKHIDDMDVHHWSHYEEYLKNSSLKKIRNSNLDNIVVSAIKNGEVQAFDMRKLGDMAKAKNSNDIITRILDSKISILDGLEEFNDMEKIPNISSALDKFRKFLNTLDENMIHNSEDQKCIIFNLEKIVSRINELNRKIKLGTTNDKH